MPDDLRARVQVSLTAAYDVERELGGGGMSRTYVALEKSLGRRVVVKMLSPELAAGVSVERFKREILLAAQLQHPHVVPVLSTGDAEGLPWFTMPYVEGESLRHRLARGPLATGEAVSVLRDVARALAYSHSHGVVHRDIKPDNVLLSQGSATVTDFGIAKAISVARKEEQGGTLTMAGTSIGTPAYMAPEQAAGDPDVDHRSDIYAFGCVAYEVLAGRPPFQASSAARLIAAQLSETARDVRELRPDTPDALAALVMQCLRKEPGGRPQQATDLVRVLDTVTSSGATAAAPAVLSGRIHVARALALWTVSTAIVAITAWAAAIVIGLPDWVVPGAIAVMLAGLPMIAFTAWVQRVAHAQFTATPTITPGGGVQTTSSGTLANIAIKASPHVSWRRTWMGGATAVGAFAVLVIGFMVLRALGIGPVGSLLAAGKLTENDQIVVTDFASPAGDSTLGLTITEALRADLAESKVLRVMPRLATIEVLRLMQRPTNARIDFDLARAIATREGLKAVLDGDVVSLGGRYVLSTRLISAADGSQLAAFKEEAESQNDLIPAIGRLAKELRAKAGEPLRTVRSAGALERVTTGSMDALRKYAEANVVFERTGDYSRAIPLLREAVAIDSTFAMAWRRLANYANNNGRRDEARRAAVQAYAHSDRLSEVERGLTLAAYHSFGPNPDDQKALNAYEAIIARDSLNFIALNNASIIMGTRRDNFARALDYRLRAAAQPGTSPLSVSNAYTAAVTMGRWELADSVRREGLKRFSTYPALLMAETRAAALRGDYARADSLAAAVAPRMMATRPGGNMLLVYQAEMSRLRGQVRRGLQLMSQIRERDRAAGVGTPASRLTASLDSVWPAAEILEDLPAARAHLERALRRAPIDSIPPQNRNWSQFLVAASLAGDSVKARHFHAEAIKARKESGVGLADPAYDAADDVSLAFARRDAAAMLRHLERAERESWPRMDVIARYRFMAHDMLGGRDSTIAAGEVYLKTTSNAKLGQDAAFLAPMRQRLGELYEARGDIAKALENYEAFVSLWKDADAELQPRVRDVRGRIDRLRRTRG
jgi:tetratricopeptide (TPR) repeat protein/tRNA A-37 threonylcarbamoyl transferase component Bud32